MLRAIELNEIAYTELIVSIDVNTSNGKLTLLKGASARSILTGIILLLNRNSRRSMNPFLPLQWSNQTINSENCHLRSSISENQFMIHVLKNLTSDYDLQLALMEKRIGDKEKAF
jgi:hypothetical protein